MKKLYADFAEEGADLEEHLSNGEEYVQGTDSSGEDSVDSTESNDAMKDVVDNDYFAGDWYRTGRFRGVDIRNVISSRPVVTNDGSTILVIPESVLIESVDTSLLNNLTNALFTAMHNTLSKFVKLVFEPESVTDLTKLTENLFAVFSVADRKVNLFY